MHQSNGTFANIKNIVVNKLIPTNEIIKLLIILTIHCIPYLTGIYFINAKCLPSLEKEDEEILFNAGTKIEIPITYKSIILNIDIGFVLINLTISLKLYEIDTL
jgi:hypothetical protein